jgi:hypothetical protein
MPDKKISALTSLAQGDVAASTDVLPIVDTSATETKKITASALVGAGMTAGVTNVDINSGSIDGTTIGANSAAAGTFTTLTGTTKVVSPYVDAVGSAGGQLRNASGTSQLAWGAGGGSNLSLEVATNINPANAAVSIAPTGTGTVTINPATAGTMNNVAIGGSTAAAGSFTTLTTSSTVTLNGGTANGVLYLNGSKVATSGSAFVFDGTNVGIGTASPDANFKLDVQAATGRVKLTSTTGTNSVVYQANNTGGTLNVGIDSSTGGSLFGVGAYAAGVWYSGNYPLVFGVNNAEGFRLTSTTLYTASGINVGIGTSSPGAKLHVQTSSGGEVARIWGPNAYDAESGLTFSDGRAKVSGFLNSSGGTPGASLRFFTMPDGGSITERARIDSSGNLGIGTTSPNYRISAIGSNTQANFGATNNKGAFVVSTSDSQAIYTGGTYYNGSNWVAAATTASYVACDSGNTIFTNNSGLTSGNTYTPTERARITSGGDLLVGKTTDNFGTEGIVLYGPDDANSSRINVTTDGQTSINVNRLASDGDLVGFYQATTQEGSISVSGNTVSYNAFAGSHWSQLQDGSKPDILRGTVMESINELCVWPGENNERLPKSKISDTAGSKKVYGVFMAWDNDWATTNDMYVTAVGAFICRVNASVTVQEGDLLESNGDGTARVQADDIIRSSTIGKVTSTVKTHQYADGSYCVPTVLYCG